MNLEKSSDSILGIDIKEVQKIELDILLEFDRICKKYGINYQLYSGSLIGAVRHQGFIPWDDDIDVAMLRDDYNEFLAHVDTELSENYFFQTVESDPEYMNRFAKIRKNDTIFMEKLVRELDMHHGVYIDIFVFDSLDLRSIKGKLQIKTLCSLDSFFKFRLKNRHRDLEPGLERMKARLKYQLIQILPISKLSLDRFSIKQMQKLNHRKTEYVADFSNPSAEVMKKFMMKREVLEDSILWDFEGYQFPIPRDYEGVLKQAYGDYMKMPEKSQRISHHDIIKIDLNTKKAD